jgi:redox-sensitive bicupin YhaK (pirin superfamily)
MTSLKPVVNLHPAYRDDIDDLVTRRPIPGPGLDHLGAFLFLNHHGPQTYAPGNKGLPFGPHPHRGFETVTFILDGVLAHRDSAGHESIINAGGVQWMTAGSGLVHSEVTPESFKQAGGPLELLQLWVNLPARLKKTAPHYRGLQQSGIPALPADQGRVTLNLIAGDWEGHHGPFESLTGVFMTTLVIEAGGTITFDGLRNRDVFLYVIRGKPRVNGIVVPKFNLAELGEGDGLKIQADSPAFVVLGHADPIDEPVVARGPFVMNSLDEIRQAYADFGAGRLGALT